MRDKIWREEEEAKERQKKNEQAEKHIMKL